MKDFPIPVVSLDALSARLGPDSQPAEDEDFDDLPLPSGMHTFDLPYMPEATDPATLQPFMQPDGIHPNAEGVRIIAANLGPHLLELAQKVQ